MQGTTDRRGGGGPHPEDAPALNGDRVTHLERWALPAILAVAALNFLWQLGSSSYYVDEVLSIEHSLPSLSGVLTAVRMSETTPWTFFVLLHEWLYRTGSQSSWVTRLPSAIAGVALVGAVYWMARTFLDRRPALLAAALCALSPLVLEYAQQVRVYVFVMLAATVAAGATVRGGMATGSDRTRWLILGAAMAVLSLWLHYTAALVIAPLCLWLGMRAEVPWPSRAIFIGVCGVAAIAELPLLIDQYQNAPNGGLVGVAGVTWTNVVRIAETPFDARVPGGVDVIRLLAVAAAVGSALVVAWWRREAVRHGRLLAALALFAPVALLVLGLAGKDVVITRYSAVAAPFLLTAVAGAAAVLPRLPAVLLLAAALLAAAVGLLDSHRRAGFYAPAREAIAYVRSGLHPGDAIVTPGVPGDDVPLDYYGQQLLHPLPPFIAGTDTAAGNSAIAHRRRVWIIRDTTGASVGHATLVKAADLVLRARGYRAISVRSFATTQTFVVILAAPAGS